MTTNITPAETKALLDAATPGPWDLAGNIVKVANTRNGTYPDGMVIASDKGLIAPDAEFIAAAPSIAALAIEQAERIDKVLALSKLAASHGSAWPRLIHQQIIAVLTDHATEEVHS